VGGRTGTNAYVDLCACTLGARNTDVRGRGILRAPEVERDLVRLVAPTALGSLVPSLLREPSGLSAVGRPQSQPALATLDGRRSGLAPPLSASGKTAASSSVDAQAAAARAGRRRAPTVGAVRCGPQPACAPGLTLALHGSGAGRPGPQYAADGGVRVYRGHACRATGGGGGGGGLYGGPPHVPGSCHGGTATVGHVFRPERGCAWRTSCAVGHGDAAIGFTVGCGECGWRRGRSPHLAGRGPAAVAAPHAVPSVVAVIHALGVDGDHGGRRGWRHLVGRVAASHHDHPCTAEPGRRCRVARAAYRER
jgi:hypothetical protein